MLAEQVENTEVVKGSEHHTDHENLSKIRERMSQCHGCRKGNPRTHTTETQKRAPTQASALQWDAENVDIA
jgi:hypothetical protein